MGALRKTLVRRRDSQALGSMPALLPRRYTFSPISIGSMSIAAPASFRMESVASMISGPMPSPWATVMGTFVVIGEVFSIGHSMRAQGASSNGPARLIPMFLMLCHDFPGFQKDPLLGVVDYFKNVPGHLSKTFRDINVLLPELPNVGAIPLAQRAPILSGEIAKHVPASERVHIIGHSAGGIDARLLASPAGLNQGHRIASITTVGSPHHGALIANILANPTAEFAFLLPGLQPFALGIRDFTTASMAQFNRDVIDHPQVAYQSFGGTTGLLTRGVVG